MALNHQSAATPSVLASSTAVRDSPALPRHIYHYTNFQGLLGILKDAELWATDIRYLNDRSELRLTINAVASVFKGKPINVVPDPEKFAMYGDCPEGSSRLYVDDLMSRIERIWSHRSFLGVVCFSEHGDDLSQWRAYCTSGQGVSIRINVEKLLQINRVPANLGSILYEPAPQFVKCDYDQTGLAEWGDELRSLFKRDMGSPYDYREVMMQHFVGQILGYAAKFKHHAFRAESEWRLITAGSGIFDPNHFATAAMDLRFRVGAFSVVPYTGVSIRDASVANGWAIDGVCIGPNPERELSRRAVSEMLQHYEVLPDDPGTSSDSVWSSSIPLRAVR